MAATAAAARRPPPPHHPQPPARLVVGPHPGPSAQAGDGFDCELGGIGGSADRDARDQGRATAPLVRADDAVLLDTSEMSISQAADAARRIVEAARARWEASR